MQKTAEVRRFRQSHQITHDTESEVRTKATVRKNVLKIQEAANDDDKRNWSDTKTHSFSILCQKESHNIIVKLIHGRLRFKKNAHLQNINGESTPSVLQAVRAFQTQEARCCRGTWSGSCCQAWLGRSHDTLSKLKDKYKTATLITLPEGSCQQRLPRAWPDDVQSKIWRDLKTSQCHAFTFLISPCGFDLSTSRRDAGRWHLNGMQHATGSTEKTSMSK